MHLPEDSTEYLIKLSQKASRSGTVNLIQGTAVEQAGQKQQTVWWKRVQENLPIQNREKEKNDTIAAK